MTDSVRGGNLAALGTIQIFRMVAALAVNVMVMRRLGVEGFGLYASVTTLVGLASFGASMGMDRLLKREIARDEQLAGHYVATGLVASLVLSCTTGFGILAWATLVDGRDTVIAAAGLAAIALGLQSLALVPVSAFHAVRRMGLGVRGNALGRVALVLTTAGLLWMQLGVLSVFFAQIFDGAVTLSVVALAYVRQLGTASLRTRWRDVQALVRQSVPFGLNSLFVSVYLSADVLLLAHLRGDTEVGIYRGAVLLLSLFPVIAETLTAGIYPKMALHLGHPDQAGDELRFATRVLLAISVPAAVGGMLTAERLMVFIGGTEFAASALPFLVMAPLLPLRFLNSGYGMTLSALNRQGDRTTGAVLAAVLNLGANLYAIPAWGVMGAAGTTLLTEVFLAIFLRWRVGRWVSGLGLLGTLVRVGVPAAVMAAVLAMLPHMQVVLAIGLGVWVYGSIGWFTGAWRPGDMRSLRSV
jgi:O-antigen/teichoic acid export membrane protein